MTKEVLDIRIRGIEQDFPWQTVCHHPLEEGDPNTCAGWLSPMGKFFPIGNNEDHDSYARASFGCTTEELENMDWIQTRIIDTSDKPIDLFHLTRFETSAVYVTPSQYEWAAKHSVDMERVEYRVEKKYKEGHNDE